MDNKFTFDYRGRKIGYWRYGRPEKPVIVALHGFRGTHHGLLDIIKYLGDDFEIFVPDLPGFGASQTLPNGEKHNADNYAKFAAEFAHFVSKETGQEKVIAFGHSFGTLIAARLVCNQPKLFSKLILAAPISKAAKTHASASVGRIFFDIGRVLPGALGERWLAAKFATMAMSITMVKSHDKVLRKSIHAKHLAHFSDFATRQILLEAFESSYRDDILSLAKQIKIPTLIISGKLDSIAPYKEAIQLAEKIPDAELDTIENVGHIMHHETPHEVTRLIKNFVQK